MFCASVSISISVNGQLTNARGFQLTKSQRKHPTLQMRETVYLSLARRRRLSVSPISVSSSFVFCKNFWWHFPFHSHGKIVSLLRSI